DGKAQPAGRRVDRHQSVARGIGGAFAPCLSAVELGIEHVQLVVAGSDLALCVDHECAVGPFAVLALDSKRSDRNPDTMFPCAVLHCPERDIMALMDNVFAAALPVPVE